MILARRTQTAAAGLIVSLLASLPPGAGAQAKTGSGGVSRVDKVLVYSDRARVFHRASVKLGPKARRVELTDLPLTALTDTVRVESRTAEVLRVEVSPSTARLPRQTEARRLVDQIEAITDRLRGLDGARQILQAELSFVNRLNLRRETRSRGARAAPEGLFVAAWQQILTWIDRRTAAVNARLKDLAAKRKKQREALHALKVKARALNPTDASRLVNRVAALMKGKTARHEVVISYLATRARWVPSYDLRYDPTSKTVEATYYALVDQATGEDWDGAALRFSTGQPVHLVAIPELATISLGRKRDFTPRTRPRVEMAPRQWTPPRRAPVDDPSVRLLRQITGQGATRQPVTLDGRYKAGEKPADRFEDDGRKERPMKKKAPRVQTLAKLRRLEEHARDSDDSAVSADEAPSRSKLSPPRAPSPVMAAPMERTLSASSVRRPGVGFAAKSTSGGWGGASSAPPRQQLPWSDTGYRPPHYHQDLPAASAKGYLFVLYAPGRHRVAATGTRQRVPLLRHRLKVKPIYRIVPGMSKKAYLLATVKNTTGRPILRGHANLFAGTMFAGRSWLNTSLPGRVIRLPLGVDDSIKVERHISQKTVVKGMVFKDDVTEYTVTIEIENHHRYPVEVEVLDQIPVKLGKKIEVRNFSATPTMKKPDNKGNLRWTGTVKKLKKLTFKFQIVRPKDWKVRQQDG